MPPAKSSSPHAAMMPLEVHTMCVTGQYTIMCHRGMKTHSAAKLTRSLMEPTMMAGVMMANMPWKTYHVDVEMVRPSQRVAPTLYISP
eukprot:364247-Chlamydomonas_euryale.AAC.8